MGWMWMREQAILGNISVANNMAITCRPVLLEVCEYGNKKYQEITIR
jgi:hypothetical protein